MRAPLDPGEDGAREGGRDEDEGFLAGHVTTSTARTVSIAGVVVAAGFGLGSLVFVSWEVAAILWATFLLLAAVAYASVGGLIATRHPRNPIGWLFVVVGVSLGITSFAAHYANHNGAPEGSTVAGVLAVVVPALVLPFALPTFLLLFPEGRLLSPAWRAAVGLAALAGITFTFGLLASSTTAGLVSTPEWVAAIPGVDGFVVAGGVLTGCATVAGFASLLVRHRRATADARQQLKWLMTMLAVMVGATAIALIVAAAGVEAEGTWIVFLLAILVVGFGVLIGIPAATAIAVLTFGLYDVGVVVKKTIVYGILVASLALGLILVLFLFSPVAIGQGVAGEDALGRIGSILLVVALAFVVAFRWLRRFAYRAVYGRRATPYEAIAEFTDRLGDAYSTEDVLPRTAEILRASTGAQTARVWLLLGDELRPAAVSPSDSASAPRHRLMADGELPEMPGRSFAVRHQGELLGAFSVEMPASEPLSATSERLAANLATQAGLVLRNVRLTEELRATIGELRASRQRIVSAQDDRARKLERDLHDGAQQQLVALAIKLGLAERTADERTRATLIELRAEANDALENLRDLARGIYPPLLADKGLPAAVTAQARKATVPVSVDTDGVGRYAQEVEATVYFCCLEALQNIAKYAAATQATIRLRQSNGALEFSIADDGMGFDPATILRGAGLTNMRDRLESLGGGLEIDSAPGAGTTLSGHLPAAARPQDG